MNSNVGQARKRLRRLCRALTVAALLLVTAFGAYRVLRGLDPCGNELVSESPSPDGKLKVVVFERDCGATTAASIQASVVAADAPLPSHGGNLFVADSDNGTAPVTERGTPELLVAWTSLHEIVLRHDPRARVFKSVDSVDEIHASYADLDAKNPLSSDGAAVIQDVAAAAARKDLKGVRAAMTGKFTWSFGGDSDAEQAIAEWAKDPRYLRELERVLRSGCRTVASDRIECPGRGNLRFRAGFTKIDGWWQMDYFVEGD